MLFLLIVLFAITAKSEIVIKGNEFVSNIKIESLVFPISDLENAYKILYGSGFFDNVSITKVGKDYIITVTEKKRLNKIKFVVNNKSLKETNETHEKLLEIGNYKGQFINETDVLITKKRIELYYKLEQRYRKVEISHRYVKNKNNTYDIIFEIILKDKAYWIETKIIGNKRLKTEDLQSTMRHNTKNYLLVVTHNSDVRLIEINKAILIEYANNNGYMEAKIRTVVVENDRRGQNYKDSSNDQIIYYIFDEGRRFLNGKVNLEVRDEIKELKINSLKGKWFSLAAVKSQVEIIKYEYRKFGEIVDVTYELEYQNAIINVKYIIKKAAKIVLNEIEISENATTRSFVITKTLGTSIGDYATATNEEIGKIKLQMLGHFSEIDLTSETRTNLTNWKIKAKDVNSGTFSITGSAQISSGLDKYPIVFAMIYQNSNFLGTNKRLSCVFSTGNFDKSVILSIGENLRNYEFGITQRDSFFSKANQNNNIIQFFTLNNNPDELSYQQSEAFCSVAQGLRLVDNFSLTLEGKIKAQKFTHRQINLAPQLFTPTQFPSGRCGIDLTTSFVYSKNLSRKTAINITNPFCGNFFIAPRDLILKYEPNIVYRILLSKRTDLSIKFSTGFGVMWSKRNYWIDNFMSDEITIYGIYKFGPKVNGVPIGGKLKCNASVELIGRLFFSKNSGLKLFCGILSGSVWNAKTTLAVDSNSNDFALRTSFAAGIRWRVPNTPIVFVFASIWKILAADSDRTDGFYFSIFLEL